VIEQHPVDKDKAFLCQDKSNMGPLGRTQVFSKAEGQFQWDGVSRLTHNDLAGGNRGPDPQTFLEAFCWLEQRLEGDRAWHAADILQMAQEQGYKRDTVYRAKKALGVISKKDFKEEDEPWTWRLPPLPLLAPPSLTPGSTGSTGSSVSTGSTASSE